MFYRGEYAQAAKDLEAPSQEDGKDQVLYLFDRAMALQLAGDYKESEKEFILADKMTEIKDYVSLSTEAATLFTNDQIKQYKGEDFEKVLINAFLAIDYAVSNNFEDALVECRRVNEKLYKYKFEAKRDYEQNPFARYLSAAIWEASEKYEDAYIDYKLAAALAPNFPYIKYDLVRLGKRLNRFEDLKEFQRKWGNLDVLTPQEERRSGEIILIYQQGKNAIKRPNPVNYRFPKYFRRYTMTHRVRIEAANENVSELSHEIYSVADVAIKTLDDAYAALVAKRLVGVVAKAVVADQIAQRNQLLGALAWIGMNAADQADLRAWDTLPETLQLARLHVTPGAHTIRIVGLDSGGRPTGEGATVQVDVPAGKKIFLNWRSLR